MSTDVLLWLGSAILTVVLAVVGALLSFSVRQSMGRVNDSMTALRSTLDSMKQEQDAQNGSIQRGLDMQSMRATKCEDELHALRADLERSKTEAAQNFATKFDLLALKEQSNQNVADLKGMIGKMWEKIDGNFMLVLQELGRKADK